MAYTSRKNYRYRPFFIPTVGTIHSQLGNKMFPSWEYLLHNQGEESVPNKGRLLSNKRWLLLDKCRLFDNNRIILEKGHESYRKNMYLCSRKKKKETCMTIVCPSGHGFYSMY